MSKSFPVILPIILSFCGSEAPDASLSTKFPRRLPRLPREFQNKKRSVTSSQIFSSGLSSYQSVAQAFQSVQFLVAQVSNLCSIGWALPTISFFFLPLPQWGEGRGEGEIKNLATSTLTIPLSIQLGTKYLNISEKIR
jgi:hypothetical protein